MSAIVARKYLPSLLLPWFCIDAPGAYLLQTTCKLRNKHSPRLVCLLNKKGSQKSGLFYLIIQFAGRKACFSIRARYKYYCYGVSTGAFGMFWMVPGISGLRAGLFLYSCSRLINARRKLSFLSSSILSWYLLFSARLS